MKFNISHLYAEYIPRRIKIGKTGKRELVSIEIIGTCKRN